MASSDNPAEGHPAARLGRLLTGTEARQVADRLADGDTFTAALRVLAPARRALVRDLLAAALVNVPGAMVSVLRAIEGARSGATCIEPLWTMPGHLAQTGRLTSSVAAIVDGARTSITCSTYNFAKTSALWGALAAAVARPGMAVRIYLDTNVADTAGGSSLSTDAVAEHLRPAVVLRTKPFDGGYVRNHAKFLAVDHRFLLVTSANFSWSAEHGNVEFGVLIDNPNLTESVEQELRRAEEALYEAVRV